ncbi:MAG TPA: hypothetical protein VKW04_01580, partial [Planctomycetota bacterium]|nr:hypothetical protein [Planctomycetota bacterium]
MVPNPPKMFAFQPFLRRTGGGVFLVAALFTIASPAPAQEAKPGSGFTTETKTVVLLGNGLVEESQASGYIETRLTRRFPDRRILFRNLGWTGD